MSAVPSRPKKRDVERDDTMGDVMELTMLSRLSILNLGFLGKNSKQWTLEVTGFFHHQYQVQHYTALQEILYSTIKIWSVWSVVGVSY